MKKTRLHKLISLLLVLAMCLTMIPTAFAAKGGNGKGNGKYNGKGHNKPAVERPTDSIPDLELVEDATTVANGGMLRAATYAVAEPQAETDTVKYFPVTMFDYDQVKFNNVIQEMELTGKEPADYPAFFEGIHMGNDAYSYTVPGETVTYGGIVDGEAIYLEKVTDLANIQNDDQVIIVSACAGSDTNQYNGQYLAVKLKEIEIGKLDKTGNITSYSTYNAVSVANAQHGQYADPITDATIWNISKDTNGYTLVSNQRAAQKDSIHKSADYYLSIPEKSGTVVTAVHDKAYVQITASTSSGEDFTDAFSLYSGGAYMNKDGGYNHATGNPFKAQVGTYGGADKAGNSYYIYKVMPGTKTTTSYITENINYQTYNKWTNYTKGQDGTFSGNHIYQGLVENTLDTNGQIKFNHADAGLFTANELDDDADTNNGVAKKVYTNVGLPFEYNGKTQSYSFNAKKMGAWFGGAPASNVNLTYSKVPQAHIAGQDETAAGWFPFDDSTNTETTSVKGAEHNTAIDARDVGARPNHYFGMAASIDFTMTPNGMLKDGVTPIDFHFSGDDDVWVFIDGKLVLDMGGIHNRINGDINFANGTWEITQAWDVANKVETKAQAEDIKNGTANTSGNLWTTLGTDLTTFAAQETHTLSVFYLERGAGASNCEISFNLPMKDYVNVTKDATKDSEGTSLTEKEQETVNNMDFTYTIYRNGEPYANQTYVILNATTGNATGTASTNANGQFTIKNNQTARFTTAFSEKGEIWYVEEADPGVAFVNDETKWSSTSVTVNGERKGSNTGLTSDSVEVVGSDEASGKINFLCENILDAKLANPGIVTADDRIVIDYGLPVQIDVKSNDLIRADKYKVTSVSGAQFGTVEITNAENGLLKYQLTQQLTDVEEITYEVEVSSTVLTHPDVPGSGETHTETATATGKVYVIPATSMYYEENFSDLITFSNAPNVADGDAWKAVETKGKSLYQEPGVVKTTTDSPYGSDIAYLEDTMDSNGSSMYASGKQAYHKFKYTFTGTGTSFFARTTDDSGYLRVIVKDENGTEVDRLFIDTRFLNDEGKTLYNIPVYTFDIRDKENLEYGTYTVSVTLYNETAASVYGTEFWLDGIRVQNPMNPASENYTIAEKAYSDDGEANVNIHTLRDKLIDAAGDDGSGWNGFAVLTDTNDNITEASDYISIGPKQEVYLAASGYSENVTNAQTISFTLEEWDMNHKLYLGLKAPMGNAKITINGKELTVSNTADCYYNLTDGDYISVDEAGNAKIEIKAVEGVISITNIKTTGAVKFAILPGDEIDIPGDGGEVDVNA